MILTLFTSYANIHAKRKYFSTKLYAIIKTKKTQLVYFFFNKMGCLSSFLRRIHIATLRTGHENHSPMVRREDDSRMYSLVLSVALCAVVFVLLIVSQTNHNLTTNQKYGIERGTFLVLLTGGLASLLKNLGTVWEKIRNESRRKSLSSSDYISMFFMSVFLIGYLIQTLLYLMITLETANRESSFAMWICRVLWNILLIVFPIGQTLLFFMLRKFVIEFGIHFKHLSAIILALNAAMWVFNLLEESESVDSEHYVYGVHNGSAEISNGTISLYGVWIERIGPFTKPMAVEYTLMSLSIILSMWGKQLAPNNQEMQTMPYEQISELPEDMPILSRSRVSMAKYHVVIPILFLFVLTGPMVVLEAYTALRGKCSEDERYRTYMAYQLFQLMNTTILFFFNVLTFYYLRNDYLSREQYHGLYLKDIFVILLSFLGFEMFRVFNVLGDLLTSQTPISRLDVSQNFAGFFGAILQTMVIVQIKTRKILHFNQKKIRILFLLICGMNFGYWLGDCFFVKHVRSLSSPEVAFYGEAYWHAVADILCPITIFYRFHSALEFYKFYAGNE